jgi:hypothetical protein
MEGLKTMTVVAKEETTSYLENQEEERSREMHNGRGSSNTSPVREGGAFKAKLKGLQSPLPLTCRRRKDPKGDWDGPKSRRPSTRARIAKATSGRRKRWNGLKDEEG